MGEELRLKHQRDERRDDELDGREQDQDASQLADVKGRAIDGRHHQRAERLALPFALECAAERERARERDRNPQDARGSVTERRALADETEGEDEDAGNCEEERRVDDLPAADLDEQVLARDEPGSLEECQHYLVPRAFASPAARRAPRLRCSARPQALLIPQHATLDRPLSLDLRTNSAHVTIPFAQGSRAGLERGQAAVLQYQGAVDDRFDCLEVVGRDDDDAAVVAEAGEPIRQRNGRGVVEPRERFVEEHEARIVEERALERQALTHSARKPRHRLGVSMQQLRAPQRGLHSSLDVRQPVDPGEETQVLGGGELRIEIEIVAEEADRPRSPCADPSMACSP